MSKFQEIADAIFQTLSEKAKIQCLDTIDIWNELQEQGFEWGYDDLQYSLNNLLYSGKLKIMGFSSGTVEYRGHEILILTVNVTTIENYEARKELFDSHYGFILI